MLRAVRLPGGKKGECDYYGMSLWGRGDYCGMCDYYGMFPYGGREESVLLDGSPARIIMGCFGTGGEVRKKWRVIIMGWRASL